MPPLWCRLCSFPDRQRCVYFYIFFRTAESSESTWYINCGFIGNSAYNDVFPVLTLPPESRTGFSVWNAATDRFSLPLNLLCRAQCVTEKSRRFSLILKRLCVHCRWFPVLQLFCIRISIFILIFFQISFPNLFTRRFSWTFSLSPVTLTLRPV